MSIPRFPRGTRVAMIGTSLVQQNHCADDRRIWSSARGWSTWAEILSKGRFNIPVLHDPSVMPGWEPSGRPGETRGFSGLNFGVSGQKALDIERRLDDVLKHDFDIIIVDAGTNDMMVETREAIAASRERIVDRFLAEGKTVILLPILARGTNKWAAGGAERAKANWINQISLDLMCRRANLYVFDWNFPWIDPGSPHGTPRQGYSDDGTHFSIPGGYAVGTALARYLEHFLPESAPRVLSRGDRYDAIENPRGNLIGNPFCSGNDMFAEGSAIVGQFVKNECHLLPRADGRGNWQQLSVTTGSATYFPVAGGLEHDLGQGCWFEASCEVEVDAHPGWRTICLKLWDASDGGMEAVAAAPFQHSDGLAAPYPDENWQGLLRTPLLKLHSGSRRLFLSVELRVDALSAPAAIRVGSFELRKCGFGE